MAGEFGDQELDLVKRDAVRGGGLNADERRHGHGLDREFDRIALAVDQMYDQNNDEVGRQIFPQNQEEQSPLQPEPQTQQQPNTDAVLGADVASGDENGSGGDQRDRQAENEQQQQQQLEANSDNEEEDDGDETGDDFELHDGQNEAGGGSGGGGWGVLMEGSLRVLLVEDDDSTRHVVSALLRNCSYEVTPASSGQHAWELLSSGSGGRFDLVLTDVVMPGLSGIALLARIMGKEELRGIPVIMMSSHDSMEMVLKCFQRGAADFLVKPVRKNELKNLWQHVWRRCHSVRPLALSPPLLSPLFPRHSSPPRFAVHSPCIFPQRPLPSLAVPSRPRPSPPVPLVSPS
ncbi:unnamed protein product [Closterium sp. NIES-53]